MSTDTTIEWATKTAAKRLGIDVAEYRSRIAAGLKWCRLCSAWQPRAEFARDASRGDGLTSVCRASRSRAAAGSPSPRERRQRRAQGQAWCRGCRTWLPTADVRSGACRVHIATEARARYAANPQLDRERRAAKRHKLARIPLWWGQETRQEFGNHCAYGCGRRGTTWDHIWPRSKGGISHPANVVPACSTCNSSKKANDPAPWVDRGIRAHRDPWLHLIDLAMETGQDEWVEAWQEAAA